GGFRRCAGHLRRRALAGRPDHPSRPASGRWPLDHHRNARPMSPHAATSIDVDTRPRRPWWTPLWLVVIALAATLTLGFDLAHAKWAARLSLEGSPAPALAPDSATGFTHGQRHFLGTTQRGETYRWIEAVQTLVGNE